jgi:hypothetical protein
LAAIADDQQIAGLGLLERQPGALEPGARPVLGFINQDGVVTATQARVAPYADIAASVCRRFANRPSNCRSSLLLRPLRIDRQLIRFLDDGRIEIDSNMVERSIRPVNV